MKKQHPKVTFSSFSKEEQRQIKSIQELVANPLKVIRKGTKRKPVEVVQRINNPVHVEV